MYFRFPDSFSRTIPIWCATLNRAISLLRQNNDNNTSSPQIPTPEINSPNHNCNNTSNVNNNNINNNNVNTETTSTNKQENEARNAGENEVNREEGEREGESEGEEEREEWDTDLHVPLWVSKTEKLQMESLVDKFVKSLLESGADLSDLVTSLRKPLRPIWICPSSLLMYVKLLRFFRLTIFLS